MKINYVVGTMDKENRSYFLWFANGGVYMVNKPELATIFKDRKEAEEVASKCRECSGLQYTVVNVRMEVEG